MDTDKLRSWIGLPPGPWPPDDRTLLGLGSAPATAAEAERRALTLMAKLRPHQLVHPDLVTEGMNRIAQALLAVSMAAPTVAPPPITTTRTPESADRQVMGLQPSTVAEPRPAVAARAAVAGPSEKPAEPEPVVLVADTTDVVLAEPAVGSLREDRRVAYRHLAGLRALIRAWDRLRPFFADPSETLPTAGHVLDFLEAAETARAAVSHPGLPRAFAADTAPVCVAVACQPLALAVFRSLGPSQRNLLATDWATSRSWFEAYTTGLRTAVRRSAVGRTRNKFRDTIRLLGANPEWMLAVGTAALFILAGVRVLLRTS